MKPIYFLLNKTTGRKLCGYQCFTKSSGEKKRHKDNPFTLNNDQILHARCTKKDTRLYVKYSKTSLLSCEKPFSVLP